MSPSQALQRYGCSAMFPYDEMHLSRYSVGQRHERHSYGREGKKQK